MPFSENQNSIFQSDESLLKLVKSIDAFEGYQHPHAERIAVISEVIAQKFNLADFDRFCLRQAALLHDLGELVMNRDYIQTKRLLNDQERVDMQRHPVIGEQEAAKRGFSRAVQLLIRWHHEWWNGFGYPDGLERDQIPLACRILRVVDTYVALTDSRPYNFPIPESEAKRYLVEWAGIEFDPIVVKVFLSLEDLPEMTAYQNSPTS